MKYYFDDHFLTYYEEMSVSLSTNLNCLYCLKLFGLNEIVQKLTLWLKNFIHNENFSFKDKWHISKYYCMSKAIISFVSVDNEFALEIFEQMISEQREDGGWGNFNRSTVNETSMSIISIVYLLNEGLAELSLNIIEKAKCFLESNDKIFPMWISKTLYSNVNLDKIICLSAKYATEKFIKDNIKIAK